MSIPMTNAMAQFLASREEIQIAWAREMWQRGQLKEVLNGIDRDMSVMVKQLTRGYKERSQLYAQLLQLQELVETQAESLLEHQPGHEEEEKTHENTAPSPPPPDNLELINAVQQLQGQMQQQWEFLQAQLPALSASLTTPLAIASSPPDNSHNASNNINGHGAPSSGNGYALGDALQPSSDLGSESLAAPASNLGGEDETDPTPPESSKLSLSYRKLHKLLAAGKWNEADRETTKLMLKVAGRSPTSWLRIEDIENFPAADLQAIDRLWVAYSQDTFGFSIQKQLWLDIIDDSSSQVEAWCQFGDSLGWL
ncbi:MAG: GUN4 domain-containing protein, partial [Cyanobacteria bacterium P01_H01_bin.130]